MATAHSLSVANETEAAVERAEVRSSATRPAASVSVVVTSTSYRSPSKAPDVTSR